VAQFGRTWWGQRFLAALEEFTDPSRLSRGRSYASSGRILDYAIGHSGVTARVRGSINPYFGIYKEPLYKTTVALAPIARHQWTTILAGLTSEAGSVTRLLMNEMPDDIEETLGRRGVHLLPHTPRDFITSCSCPDYANPCKHVAGVTYTLAAALDNDPLLLFELRGLSRQQLRAELAASPLGRILASGLEPHAADVAPDPSYYTTPDREAADGALTHRQFWTGPRRLPEAQEAAPRATVPALLVKKGGDYPPFWHKSLSFIGTMEEIYNRVRAKAMRPG